MSRLLAALALATAACAADPQFVFDMTMADGSGDKPMIVAWIEKADGTFVRTVQMFSKDKEYFKDMETWEAARSGKADPGFDAAVGATLAYGQHKVVKLSAKDVLANGYVLRIEQRKDKGGWYKKFKAPLAANWPGVTLEGKNAGYFAKLVITIER
jgi:hypothetical protein